MDIARSKAFVRAVQEKWRLPTPVDLDLVADMLEKGGVSALSDRRAFEFSFVFSEKSIRLLHLIFFKKGPTHLRLEGMRRRVASLRRVFEYVSRRTGCRYDEGLAERAFGWAQEADVPVQFGCVLKRDAALQMKTYLSLFHRNASARKIGRALCDLRGVDWEKIKGEFSDSGFDAIGIDYFPDGASALKFYVYHPWPCDLASVKKTWERYSGRHKGFLAAFLSWLSCFQIRHIGFLYRVSSPSEIDSVKIWIRLKRPIPHGLPAWPGPLRRSASAGWLYSVNRWVRSFGGAITYLSVEGDRLGLYFR